MFYFLLPKVSFFVLADSFGANLVLNEGESVYDFCWYPYMSASGASKAFQIQESV